MVDKTTIVHWYRIYMAKNLNSDVVKSRIWHKLIHNWRTITSCSRCLKITEKVSFNIASEASYFYILSGQKLVKNAKNGQIWRVLENLELAVKQSYQTARQVSFNRTKIGGKSQKSNATFWVIFKQCFSKKARNFKIRF